MIRRFFSVPVLFLGAIGALSAAGSKAAPGRPNVVVILIDDIGYSDTSTFGGVAQTPYLTQFSAQGIRYANFNNTSICSSTRAALLTGLNHHRVGFGALADMIGTTPGYDTMWKKGAPSIAKVLSGCGYSTVAIGKWHDTPWKQIGPDGPFDRWPTGLGFDYFYGFMEPGAQSQWEPASLYENTTPVEPWGTPQQGYHLTTDLTDHAIRWLQTHRSVDPRKPYFLYFATGAVHFPHHVPREWIDRYKGQFDEGWDKMREEVFARQKKLGVVPANAELTPRPKEFPAWASLSPDQKKLFAREMEVYAGYISQTDHEVGRLVQAIRQAPDGDNTIIFYLVGDNGGSPGGEDSESFSQQLHDLDELGGPKHNNGLTTPWAWAGSVPFQWYKGVASHFGGTRDPLIVSWPGHVKDPGAVRFQFCHVNDIAPTIYDAVGVTYPQVVDGVKTLALDGVSFAFTFNQPKAPSHHETQYFEMFGNRAIYQDGWVAAARHSTRDYATDPWELYHVADDYSEAHNVAAEFPDKLKSLRATFVSEAQRNDVFPLGGYYGIRTSFPTGNTFVYHAGMPRLIALAAPNFLKSHRITADVVVPKDGAEGILLTYGGRWGGFVLYVKDGHLVYENKPSEDHCDKVVSNVPVPEGEATLACDFTRDASNKGSDVTGTVRLLINGQPAGEVRTTIQARASFWGSFGIGEAFGSPVSDAYAKPFKFTGELKQVKVELR